MALENLALAVNTAGTLSIGAICFFIVYTTFKGINDERIQEFSKRFMMAISMLILYVSYFAVYNSFFRGSALARYPLYLSLIIVFVYLVYAAIGFERVAEEYGLSQQEKIEKMGKEELGN